MARRSRWEEFGMGKPACFRQVINSADFPIYALPHNRISLHHQLPRKTNIADTLEQFCIGVPSNNVNEEIGSFISSKPCSDHPINIPLRYGILSSYFVTDYRLLCNRNLSAERKLSWFYCFPFLILLKKKSSGITVSNY